MTVLVLGLLPSYPVELRVEYGEADQAKKLEMFRIYQKGRYYWSLLISGVSIAMLIKWVWECGFLVLFGATAGFAHASDLQKAQIAQTTSNTQLTQRLDRYEKSSVEESISRLKSEEFQLKMAISAAERNGQQADTLHVNRLQAVGTELGRLAERLRQLSPPAAASVTSQ